MSFDPEIVMAYVDGELDAAETARFEAALARDKDLVRAVERERSLRRSLARAYDPVLTEPMPKALGAALRDADGATVVELAEARAARTPPAVRSWRTTWSQWGAMAACLLVGVLGGRFVGLPYGGGSPAAALALHEGRWLARGALEERLSHGLASEQDSQASIRVGLSILTRDKVYCRSFAMDSGATQGLACRAGDDWQVRVWSQGDRPVGDASGLRTAASPTSAAVLGAVDALRADDPLDAAAEGAARDRGWKP